MCLSWINKTNQWWACMMLLVCCISCKPSLEEARTVGDKFLYARFQGNYADAGPYISRQSKKQFNQLKQVSPRELGGGFKGPTYTILRTEEAGDYAYVYYQVEGFGEDRVKLTVEGGNWKVVLPVFQAPGQSSPSN